MNGGTLRTRTADTFVGQPGPIVVDDGHDICDTDAS
jgi:hypothetical protein